MKVTVFNTVGSAETTIDYEGSTKSDLVEALSRNNIPYGNMSFMVMENEITLESTNAQTPTLDQIRALPGQSDAEGFTLFLVPVKVDSGFDDDATYGEGEYREDDDDNNFDVPAVSNRPILSLENQQYIKMLEDAKFAIDAIIAKVKGDIITNPRVLALQAKAAQMMNNKR